MRFKLDENLGASALRAFADAGHDASTVHLQRLAGASDPTVFQVCVTEQRILVTLDLDFANPLVFDPRPTAGVAVLRQSRSPGPTELRTAIATLLDALGTHDQRRIVEPGVVLCGGGFQADSARSIGDLEDLTGLACESGEQLRESSRWRTRLSSTTSRPMTSRT